MPSGPTGPRRRAPALVHGDELPASPQEKRAAVAEWLARKLDAVVVSALDSMPGCSISGARCGTHAGRAVVRAGPCRWHRRSVHRARKGHARAGPHLGNAVRIPIATFVPALGPGGQACGGRPERAVAAIFATLDRAGARPSR
jgi:Xaa-Pro aminopeptidase